MNDNLDQAMQRAKRYWYIDGLNEIAFGAFCLLIGLFFYLHHNLPPGSPLYLAASLGFVLVILGGAYGMRWAINTAKERLTYPRSGYIAYKSRSKEHRIVRIALAVVIAILVAIFYNLGPLNFDWAIAFNGLVIAGGWAWAGYRVGAPRFYVLALISLAAGAGLAVYGLGTYLGLAILFALTGLASLLSGVCTLLTYLRATRPTPEASDE